MPKHPNTFDKGLNTDISDLVMPSNMMRNCKNMRMLDLDGTSYAVTTIKGTELKFTLTPNYIPIASVQYGDVLYIMSGLLPNTGAKFERFEIGSYPSPNYITPTEGVPLYQYAPFQNLDDGPFNVGADMWDIDEGEFVDISIQPEYDRSANVIITAEDNPPRIINSKFNTEWLVVDRREGANTNEYTSDSVDEETRLILRSQEIMNVAYGGIENGGKLQPGNYVYVFRYATADFNETDVVNQSSICSVFEGYEADNVAASIDVETTKRVRLSLSNVDTDFAYLKVYFKYNQGDDSNIGLVYEFTQPIAINNRESFDFIHDGFEETAEVSADTINLDFTAFDSVATHTQAQGYLLLGNSKESSVDYEELAEVAQGVTARETGFVIGAHSPYTDPRHIYESLSYFSGESYALGIVYIMNDGSVSPAFPVQGYDEYNWSNLTTQQQDDIKAKGILRFNDVEGQHFNTIVGTIPKGITFDLSSVPVSIKEKTIGCFFVRAERKRDLVSQGVLIPTLRVPPIDFTRSDQVDDIPDGNYYDSFSSLTDYKNFPILDNLVEPWKRLDEGVADDAHVIKTDGTNRIDQGYMPSVINNFDIPPPGGIGFLASAKDPFSLAYYSADYILNEARYITALQRSNMGYTQWGRVNMKAVVDGTINNKWKDTGVQEGSKFGVSTSLLYKFLGFLGNYNGAQHYGAIDSLDYVPTSTFSTGHDFVSAMAVRFRQDGNHHFETRSFVDAYFGFKGTLLGTVLDPDSPYNQPVRTADYDQCEGPAYDNIDTTEPRAYFISIYPRPNGRPIEDINQLYDSTDGLSYRQIGDRFAWADAAGTLDIYGGDCYIGEIHKKLNRSGYTDPKEPSSILGSPSSYEDGNSADNINQGVTFSFLQECEYNPALRLPYLEKIDDPEKRTFYPYRNPTDYNKFRDYRLEGTNKTNQGYGETNTPKVFVAIPSNAPFIAQNFFTRIIHSEKHVPNAFQNGYRSFIGVNHEDYDPDMGEIVRLLTHRDQVFVVFEHGIGIGPVNQRIQTGSDTAGGIFVEPSGVLPPNLGFASRELGAQHGNAIVQTPSSIYGIDKQRKKIWQFREGLTPISDMGMQQLMEKSALENITMGYDPHYHEVIFTTDEWTLCYKEGLENFTSFYSYRGYHYARRAKDFYSFNNSTKDFQIHNVPVRTIYGNIEESYVEIVVNPAANETKVYDWLNIVSNEVSPKRIDLYTYKIDTFKEDVLVEANMFQHSFIDQGTDIFTEEDRIRLRDRKWVAQIPDVSYIDDAIWGIDGRFRNKYVIVRLTYETLDKVEILSVITDFRISRS